jgi:hypothetical protein
VERKTTLLAYKLSTREYLDIIERMEQVVVDKCMLNKYIVISSLDITSFRGIEEMRWAELL